MLNRTDMIVLAGLILFGTLATSAMAGWPQGRSVQEGPALYRIWTRSEAEADSILSRPYRIVLTRRGQFVDVLVGRREARELLDEGYALEWVQDDPEGFMHRLGADPTRGRYHSYDEMVVELQDLASRYPDTIELVDIGDTWEKEEGLDDRDIWAVRITAGDGPSRLRPEVLFLGGVHSREIATTEVLLHAIRTLARESRSNPRIQSLLKQRRLWFIPLLNPDGREHVFALDPWWRKNRRVLGIRKPVGVDLNRNFSYHWADRGGSSDNPFSGIYRGPKPFSEPESRALRDFVDASELSASLSFHAYGEYVLTPYGYAHREPEHAEAYGALLATLEETTGYSGGTVTSVLGYYSCGRHDDWLYGDRGIVAAEIELGRTFFPPEEELPVLGEKMLAPILATARMAGPSFEAALELRAPEGRDGLADPRRSPLTLSLRNRGLETARGIVYRLKALDSRVELNRTTGHVGRIPGLREGEGRHEIPLVALHPQPGELDPVDVIAIEIELAYNRGIRDRLVVELPLGPALTE